MSVDKRYEALAYIDKTLDNVCDLRDDLPWQNDEVIEMLADIRNLLVFGSITSGSPTPS